MDIEEILLEASSYHIRSEVVALSNLVRLIYPKLGLDQCYNLSLKYLLKMYEED